MAISMASCTSDRHAVAANGDATRDAAAGKFTSQPVPRSTVWRSDTGPARVIWRTYIPNVGVFTTNDNGTTVLSAVLTHNPTLDGPALPDAALINLARSFASAHVPQLSTLQQYRTDRNDHRTETLLTVTWRERRQQAWFPKLVTVSTTIDGRPVAFGYTPTGIGVVNTTPTISTVQAMARATAAAGPDATPNGAPELDVIGPPASPHLVWTIDLAIGKAPAIPTNTRIIIDAHTGQVD
jgi:hypothetical protein